MSLPQNISLLRPKARVLVIDDDPEMRTVLEHILSWDQYEVTTLPEPPGSEYFTQSAYDVVLLDIRLQSHRAEHSSSLEWLVHFKQKKEHPYTPVVIISGDDNPETIVNALDRGADDYIIKPFAPPELLARIRAQLRISDLTRKLMAANMELQAQVEIDDLTGLFNMRSMYNKIHLEIERAKRYNRYVCVVMMDMDYFKSVNDGHDHLFGSYVLSQVGRIIRNNIRTIDVAARYGGDEFLILLTETHPEGAQIFCERLRDTIAQTLFVQGRDEIQLTASLGYAIVPAAQVPIDAQTLARIADHQLYEAKRGGRNQTKGTTVTPEMLQALKHKVA